MCYYVIIIAQQPGLGKRLLRTLRNPASPVQRRFFIYQSILLCHTGTNQAAIHKEKL